MNFYFLFSFCFKGTFLSIHGREISHRLIYDLILNGQIICSKYGKLRVPSVSLAALDSDTADDLILANFESEHMATCNCVIPKGDPSAAFDSDTEDEMMLANLQSEHL